MSHVSMTHHIKEFDVRKSPTPGDVVATFDFDAMLHLDLEDARRFHQQLGEVIAEIDRDRAAEPSLTESGMTELDCAVLHSQWSRPPAEVMPE